MADDFASYTPGLEAPASSGFTITPSDGADLAKATRAIYVGGAGSIRATFVGGGTVTFTGLQAGVAYPFRVSRVFSTSTTATGLVGLV